MSGEETSSDLLPVNKNPNRLHKSVEKLKTSAHTSRAKQFKTGSPGQEDV